jgi:hypothetical protein
MRRGNATGKGGGGKPTGRIQQGRNNAGMEMAGILREVVAPFHDDFCGTIFGSGYFEAGQPVQARGLVCRNELLKIQP